MPDLGIVILGFLALTALFSACLFLAFARRSPKIPEGKGVHFLDDKYRPWAFVGVGFILGLVCVLLLLKPSRSYIMDALRGVKPFTPSKVIEQELVAIQTFHGTYVTAMNDQPGWNWELWASSDTVEDWERFTLLRLENGKVALKTYHGRFVTVTGDDECCNWVLRAETERDVAGEFSLVDIGGGKVAFETRQGRYVSATDGGQCWRVRAEAESLDDWEKFTLIQQK